MAVSNNPTWRDYVPFWNAASSLPIREVAFQNYVVSTKRGEVRCKSMLSSLELAYLHHAARDLIGSGAIVDLGPFCGIGTLAMASGLAASQQAAGNIHSYDLFLLDEYHWFFDGDVPPFGSVFPMFQRITEDYRDRVVAIPGDLLKMQWDGSDIALLFVDIAKAWPLNEWVVRQTFPCLRPGSILIQQDFVHFHEWWLGVTMGHFADHFRFEETIYGGSAIYTCTTPISEREAAFDLQGLPLAKKLDLMDRAGERMHPSAREVLKCARAQCFLAHGAVDDARRTLATVDVSKMTDDPALDFSGIAASNLEAVEREITTR